MIQQELDSELQELDKAIAWAESGLKRAPEGRLLVTSSGKVTRYYHRKSTQDKIGTYLGAGNEALIGKLAQKDYETSLLKAADKRKAQLEKAQKLLGTADDGENILVKAYQDLPDTRKKYVTPFTLDDEAYAQQWQSQEYQGNSHPYGALTLFTRRGEQVRSKSEIIIADALDAAGVPYRYEYPLFLDDFHSVYPDFTVLNKRTRKEYIWEHFGGLDDPDYRESMVKRINEYALNGYFVGGSLIATYETAETPLDTRVVNGLIQQFLL